MESSHGKKTFVFDRVFQDTEKQEAIWDYVSGGIDSFVQGYNVSLLAYGQSGAGKSYTMGTIEPGELIRPSAIGIIPRAAASLFEKLSPSQPKQSNGTGLRMPKRYSTLPNAPADNGAAKTEDKSWQLTATYVEVCTGGKATTNTTDLRLDLQRTAERPVGVRYRAAERSTARYNT